MCEPQQASVAREPYQKPRLRTIELNAEEVLGVGCKTATSPGTNPGSASNCTGTTCAAIGS